MSSQLYLTVPDCTCENWQKHRLTVPLYPLFRGVQVQFGTAALGVRI